MKVLIQFDEELEQLTIKHPNSTNSIIYPASYIPELIESLLSEENGLNFFYQNLGIERDSKSVKIVKLARELVPLLQLTPSQAKKLVATLRTSFSMYL